MGFLDSIKKNVKSAVGDAVSGAGTRQVQLSVIPASVEEMKALPEFTFTNPDVVAAMAVCAFCVYSANKDAAIEMLNALKGPEPLSTMEKNFLRDRLNGKDYLPCSYFVGATPENGYEPAAPYTVPVKEQANSRDEQGYIKLFLISGGADSPRPIKLRQKASTGEWFLYEYSSILSGIREPKGNGAWD